MRFIGIVSGCVMLSVSGWGAPSNLPVRAVSGRSAVSGAALARFYGARWEVMEDGGARLTHPRFSLRLHADGRRATLMGVGLMLRYPPPDGRGRIGWLHRTDVEDLLDPILRPSVRLRDQKAAVIVLDPGHGGRDGGAVGVGGLLEKDLTLDVALRARALLAVSGLEVVLTRETDEFVALDERVRRAAAHRADVLISLHFNAAPDARVRGIETYIAPSDTRRAADGPLRVGTAGAESRAAASAVLGFLLQCHTVRRTGGEDRGLRQAPFAVLREATVPAALVEGGFLSNPEEARRIVEGPGRDRLAEGIARAVADYAAVVRRARLIHAAMP